MGHVRIQSLSCFQSIDILRITSDQLPGVAKGFYEAMRGCHFLHIFADLIAERRDESIEDCCADGIFPQLTVKEVFAFDVAGDRKASRFGFGRGRGRAKDFSFDIPRG